MFRVQFDNTEHPDQTVEADQWQQTDEFIYFIKGDEFVAAVRAYNILAIHFEKGGE